MTHDTTFLYDKNDKILSITISQRNSSDLTFTERQTFFCLVKLFSYQTCHQP